MSASKNLVSLEILREQIRTTRNRMQQLWNEKGCTDAEILNTSIELDCLMNVYQRMTGFFRR